MRAFLSTKSMRHSKNCDVCFADSLREARAILAETERDSVPCLANDATSALADALAVFIEQDHGR